MKPIRKLLAVMLAAMMALTPLMCLKAGVSLADSALDEALNIDGGTLTFQSDGEYPFEAVTLDDGRVAGVSTNQSVSSSTSSFVWTGEVNAGMVLTYDVKVSTEERWDKFMLKINGTEVDGHTLSGLIDWTFRTYVFSESGEYTIEFSYIKDSSVNRNDDTVWIDNVSISDPVAVTGIELNYIDLTVYIGTPVTLTATVTPQNATDKSLIWESSDTDVAIVSANGLVTAVSEGTAVITVTTNDGGFTASCNVTVPAPIVPQSITLSHTSGTIVSGQYVNNVVATVLPENAYDKTVTWSSSDTSVVTVDALGKITAVNNVEGTATVTATTINGLSASIEITTVLAANAPGLSDMVWEPAELNTEYSGTIGWGYPYPIAFGRSGATTTYLTPTHGYGYAVELEAGTYNFLSYSPDGTYFDAYMNLYDSEFNYLGGNDSSGGNGFGAFEEYTITEAGTYYVLITAYYYYSVGNYSFMVEELLPVAVEGVELASETVEIATGESTSLSYSILPAEAANPAVTWTSSDETIATVDENGLVTGVAPGEATITVTTVDGGFTDTCTVIVSSQIMIWSENFDNPTGWTRYDANYDSYDWYFTSGSYAHGGFGGYAASDSFDEDYQLEPDNWLISPAVSIPDDGNAYNLKYYIAATSYPGEYYSLYISTTGTSVSQFTLIGGETVDDYQYMMREVDLSEYAGQTVYFAWRHHNCADVWTLRLDTISVSAPGGSVVTPEDGDVNGDGVLTSADALLTLRAALGAVELTPEEATIADIDGSGAVTAVDALIILRMSLLG